MNGKTFQVTIYSPEDGEEQVHSADGADVIKAAAVLLSSMEVGAYVTLERTG
jgi:hypothetical protein